MRLKETLKGIIPDEKLEKLVQSFDIIGNIVVIEIPDELKEFEKIIGEKILENLKHVKTVCKKAGIHEGPFRIRPCTIIAGENKTETIHKESGVLMKLDVNKVYFSPRLSFERERIANLVKPGEKVAVFFAGVGPFALVIGKKQPLVSKIYGIELNPDAYKYFEENIKLNKMVGKIVPIFGDVKEKAKEIEKCDRVIMPLPKNAPDFLESALECLKEVGYIHIYGFGSEENPFEELEKKVEEKLKNVEWEITNKRIVRTYAPRVEQVVFDIKIRKNSTN
ncbi:MAG: class I SAM-dependent methyltransferase family protein [archaeon]